MSTIFWAAAIILIVAAFLLLIDGWRAFGDAPEGTRLERVEASSNWRNGKFRNNLPLKNYMFGAVADSIRSGSHKEPNSEVSVYVNDGSIYELSPETGFRLTWLGHSTLLLELDGSNLLIDPIWGERVSPFRWFGPKRWYEPPIKLEQLPRIDAVLISHDHYDHLDQFTIERLADRVGQFVVPLGVGAHLEYWGVQPEKIVEVDWWQSIQIGEVEIVSTPARHASGRQVLDLDKTLWTGFAILGSKRIYYSGDTGMFPGFKEIGDRYGPFDLTMIEVGAYSRNWPDWHLGPEQAVIANQWVKGRQMLPLHWGLFNLALHNWTEPMERVLSASAQVNLAVVTPQPGQPFEPGVSVYSKWWPDLPWQGADEHAVLSTQLDDLHEHEESLINGQSIEPRS